MTVKELKRLLSNYIDDAEVYLSIDEEGNGFAPVTELGNYFMDVDNRDTIMDTTDFYAARANHEVESDAWAATVVLWP